jgi:phage anti-repressor protein
MNELIKVDSSGMTTAKELYEFLELNISNFSKWCKTNIVDNKFAEENVDWLRLVLNDETPTGGKIERIDYSVTIDFAKKLCMVSKSLKGEQARNYFIEIEKRYISSSKQVPMTLEDLIIMQAQSVKELKAQVNEIALSVERLQQAQSRKTELIEVLPVVNEKTIRASINQVVRGWASRNNIDYSNAFNQLYLEFYYRYSIDLKTRSKNRGTTSLDVAEKNGSLKELLSLAVNLFA